MKETFVITICLSFWNIGISQSLLPGNPDSLQKIWGDAGVPDSTRCVAIQKSINMQLSSGNPDSALYLTALMLDFARTGGLSKFEAGAWYLRAVAFTNSIQYIEAEKSAINSLMISENTGDTIGQIKAMLNLGLINSKQGRFENSLGFYSRALKLDEEIRNKHGMVSILIDIGIIHKTKGELTEAINSYTRGLQISEEIGDTNAMAACLGNIGTIYQLQGETSLAVSTFMKCLKIFDAIGDKYGKGGTFNNIGNMYLTQGDFTKAMEYCTRSLKIREEINDKKGMASSLNTIAIIHRNQGDYDKAIEFSTRGLKINEEILEKKGAANSLNNLAIIYRIKGDWVRAIELFTQSKEIGVQIGNISGISTSLINIGNIYSDQENFQVAMDYYNQGLILSREIGNKLRTAGALTSIATLYLLEGDRVSKSLNDSLAMVYYAQAIRDGEMSLQLGMESSSAEVIKSSLRLLYSCYRKTGGYEKAKNFLASLIHCRNNDLNINYFTLTEYEKELYFETMETDFDMYYDFAVFYSESFPEMRDTTCNLILRNKGLTLKSSAAMRSALLNSGDSILISEYESWITLKRKISDAFSRGNELTEVEKKANELEKELVKRSTDFGDFEKIIRLDWRQIQAALEPDECAIEFTHFKTGIEPGKPVIYAALIIRRSSSRPEIVRLCTEADIIAVLGNNQGNNFNFVNKLYGTSDNARVDLYKKIWLPLESSLNDVKTVYYSPTGLLHKVSFSAISNSTGAFLSDVYDFRLMTSTGKILNHETISLSDTSSFYVIGGVDYFGDSTRNKANNNVIWSYLPGTLEETGYISSFLTKKGYRVIYSHSENATEKRFKAEISGYDIVHVATHGYCFPDPDLIREGTKTDSESNSDLKFRSTTSYANWSFVNNKNPLMRSGIVLANANDVWFRGPMDEGEDGVLTAQEVSNLDLSKTKLVVLSACETGLGDIKGSEGVYGLQRAFKMAGVKYIIMSLWQVPDKETAEFMTTFYKNLTKTNDIRKSFNLTQRTMREKYDPYYWAAFVLIE